MTDTTTGTSTEATSTEADAAAAAAAATEAEKQPDAAAQEAAAQAEAAKTAEGEGGEDKGQQQDEAGEEKKDEVALTGAPEAYEDFAAPEGVELDAEVATDLKTLAKDLDLSQVGAQKVADLGVKLAEKWATQAQENYAAEVAKWKTTTETDSEIGGDALPANLAVAKQALDKYGTPALVELLEKYGLGDHPEIIRYNLRVGKTLAEDTPVSGGNAEKPRTDARGLYPNSNMN